MAGPIKTKTWNHYAISCPIGSGPAQQSGGSGAQTPPTRQLLWEIKNALVSGTNPWVVTKSCAHDGVNFVYGDVDYWTSAARVWFLYSGEFSWIVLKQNAIYAPDPDTGGGYQILIVCNTAPTSTHTLNIYISTASNAFTGGSTTARPTAVGEYQALDNSVSWTSGSNVARGAHVFKSTDGECTRVYTTHSAAYYRTWIFDKGGAPLHSSWAIPSVTMVNYPSTYNYLIQPQSSWNQGVVRVKWGNTHNGVGAYLATEGVDSRNIDPGTSGPLGRQPAMDVADMWGNWICTLAAVINTSVYGPAGVLGWMQDFWFTSDNLVDGDYFPGDGTKQFVVFGDTIQPNEDGTVVTLY